MLHCLEVSNMATFIRVGTAPALQVKICNCIVDDTGLEPATLSLGS